MKWKTWREWFRIVHLWIGIIGGLFIFVICLTGTILVYQDDVIQLLNKEVYHIEPQIDTVDVTSLISHVENETNKSVLSIRKDIDKSKAWQFAVRKSDEKGRPETVFVNPYTSQILGNAKTLVGKDFFMFNFKLHRWFLMDTAVGRPIVGFFTIAFVIALLTGLVIWFPKKLKNYKKGFKIKWRSNWKRINHDFHSAFGLYASLFLLIMGLTGLFWSFEWYKDGVSKMIGTQVFDRSKTEIPIEDGPNPSISLNSLISTIETDLFQYDKLAIGIPKDPSKAMEVSAYHTGFASLSLPDKFYYNQHTAEQVEVQMFSSLPFNQKVAKSIHDLHMGYLFGPLNKIIFFITSIIASLLPITGFLIWANRKKWWKKKKNCKNLSL